VRLVVVFLGELHRVRRHHRQVQARGQLHGGGDVDFVVVAAGALQLDVEAVREQAGELQRRSLARLESPCSSAWPTGPAWAPDSSSRPSDSSCSHSSLQTACARTTLRVQAAGQQLAQVQVALVVLHQQQHARDDRRVLAHALQHDFAAHQRLQAGARAPPCRT
jgi:hypothetical protein